MDTAKVVVRYMGDDVRDGTMDVRDLGPSLVAFARAVQAASSAVNGDRGAVVVRISADVERRSFGVKLDLIDFETATGLLASIAAANLTNINGILDAMNGAFERIRQWYDARRAADAGHAVDSSRSIAAERGAIVQQSKAGGDVYNVAVGAIIASDDAVRQMIELARPLERQGIEGIEVRNESTGKTYRTLHKNDVEALKALVPTGADPSAERIVRVRVELVRPSFRDYAPWTFEQGKKRWSAPIEDDAFLKDVYSKAWKPEKGDVYDVEVRVRNIVRADGSTATARAILRVFNREHGDGPQLLLPGPNEGGS